MREVRLSRRIPVQVEGEDLTGTQFAVMAHTVNISRQGARLRGVAGLKGPGEVIQVHRAGDGALFRVVWVGRARTPLEGQVGICIWPGMTHTMWKLPSALSEREPIPQRKGAELTSPPIPTPKETAEETRAVAMAELPAERKPEPVVEYEEKPPADTTEPPPADAIQEPPPPSELDFPADWKPPMSADPEKKSHEYPGPGGPPDAMDGASAPWMPEPAPTRPASFYVVRVGAALAVILALALGYFALERRSPSTVAEGDTSTSDAGLAVSEPAPAPSPALGPAAPRPDLAKEPPLPRSRERESDAQFGVQLGAFSSRAVAEALAQQLASRYPHPVVSPIEQQGKLLYRVRIPTETRTQADQLAARLRKEQRLECWVVKLD